VRPHPPGAADAGLDLVEAEQGALLPRELARGAEVSVRRRQHPGLALDRLHDERGGPLAERRLERREVAEGHVAHAGDERLEAVLVLLLAAHRDGEERPAVEGVPARDDLVPLRMAEVGVVLAGELEHRLVRLRAAVAEEGAPGERGDGEERLGELHLARHEEVVRDVPDLARLLLEGADQGGVAVPERDDGDPAEEVEVLLGCCL
jgi:hypothetical protein